MSIRNLLASILFACLLATGFAGFVPAAQAASAGQVVVKRAAIATPIMTQVGHRRSGVQIIAPIAPSYWAYDYPYYYSRGYYPTHIGPGYIYKHAWHASSASAPQYSRRCTRWHRKCSAHWGYGSDDYEGCMDFHRCE